MTAPEWERIKALFDAALAISAENRLRWLQDACAESPELYETVVQLLHNYDESSWTSFREVDTGPVFSVNQLVANRFRILRLVARGGMGEVYEAIDNGLHGLGVALKALRLGLAMERQAYERFKREVWVIREIRHEGLCQMFDLAEHRGVGPDGTEMVIPCLTMQMLDGENLKDFLERRRPLSTTEALPLIRQIAPALAAMHEKEIVHRDLKPSNIMLIPNEGRDGFRVVLIDFGLAKRLNPDAVWETHTVQAQGAPYFIAPEVLSGKKGGVAADVYALGLVIDEMVTRSPAFPHEWMEELLCRKLQQAPLPPSTRSDNLPGDWERVILSCLDPDPDRRPKSVLTVLDALESRGPLPNEIGTTTRSRLKASLRKVEAHAKVSRRLWIGAATTAAVVSGVGAVGVLGPSDPPLATSILVFPFQNLSKEQEYDHLCIGTVEELMRRLTYIQGLNVYPIPKSWSPDPSAMKKAQFSLKGSLQQFEGKVRLSVRLTENDGGGVIWAETFDRTLSDPLALESEIAEKTVEGMQRRAAEKGSLLSQIRVVASGAFGVRRAVGPGTLLPNQATASSAALDEYQRGRELCQTRTLPCAIEAMTRFQRAIDTDSNFALAYAALADVHPILLNYNYAPTVQLLSDALRYAEKGVALNASLPECHTARGAAQQNLWEWEESQSSYRSAIEKQPKFARAHHWYAGLIQQFGRFDEALERARFGLDLDPFDYPAHSNYGLYLWNAGRVKEAAAKLEGVLQRADLIYAHNVLGQVYADLAASSPKGEATSYYVRSLAEGSAVQLRDLEAAGGSDPGYLKWSDLIFTQAHAARGDHTAAQHFVIRLERGFQAGKISAAALAWAYAAVGNRNRTLDLLEHGLELREREMLNIRVIPLFRTLHGERRFDQILRRMKLA